MIPLPENRSSFLVIRFSSLGDILLTTPALRCLRRAHPDARLDVLVKERYAALLDGNPHVSAVLTLPEPGDRHTLDDLAKELAGNYDTVIDLHTSLRSHYLRRRLRAPRICVYRKHRFRRWLLVKFKVDVYRDGFSIPLAYLEALKPLGVEDDGKGLEWRAANASDERFHALAGGNPPVALCPGASFATKRWLPDYWEELADRLIRRGDNVWVFGDASDAETGERIRAVKPDRVINFCGSLSLTESGAGISACRLAVTLDAGPAHMAAAVGTPVVVLFGSTDPRFGFAPFRIPHRICAVDLHCRPCSHLGFDRCPKEHFRCMKDLTPETVFRRLTELEDSLS